MGCNVVTAYTDEAVGHIGYPQQIITDIYERNYCTGNLLKQVLKTHPYYILGFNQSYSQSKMFTYILNKKQYLVFSAARFLIIMDCIDKKQKSLVHQDKIIALDMKGKLCLTGSVGGRIILWDLEFFEQKINIKISMNMQSQIINFSSISFSDKYIFCTDIKQPNNNVYCYDLRTAKFKAKAEINSYQLTLKGTSWGLNRHVTVAADGVWFCKYVQNSSQIEVTKGMFRIFPKTSMTCVNVVNQTYVITGSADGYVFLWAHYQCQKVMKVADSTISDMMLNKNKLIVSNFSDNVRVFQYTIKEKKQLQDHQIQNGQITEDFVSIIIDSYDRQPLQCIVVSKLDESIYYSQTRNGLLFNKMIPSSQYQHKMEYYKEMDKKIIQFDQKTQKYIHNDAIWLVKLRRQFFQIKKIQTKGPPQTWKVNNIFVSNAKKYIGSDENCLHYFIPQLGQMCYVGKNKVYLCDIIDISINSQLNIDEIKQEIVLEYISQGASAININKLTPFKLKQNLYIILYHDQNYFILKKQSQKWAKVEVKQISEGNNRFILLEEEKLKFQYIENTYQLIVHQKKSALLQKMSFMHCVNQIQTVSTLSNGKEISIGGGIALIK